MAMLARLYSPIRIGALELKNRIVMAPMTTGWAAANGTFSPRLAAFLEARARGGVGLIITEVATVDGTYPYVPQTLGLWDDAQIAPMREFIQRIHRFGTKIIPQIAHPGPESISVSMGGPQPVGPSVIRCPATKQLCRELAAEEIPRIIELFAEGARRAREAGFDGLELHAAHSYMLLGSFLSGLRNRRTDRYGGSLEGRLTLILEVIQAIKSRAGSDFPLIVRLSGSEIVPGGRDIRGTQYIVPILRQAGVDGFHISGGAFADAASWILPTTGMPRGLNTVFSKAVKEVTDAPVIVVGRIDDPRFAEDILARGEADAVAMGRPLLADPELPNKAAAGRFDDIAPCTGCLIGCRGQPWVGKNITCVINPACGKERYMEIIPASEPKRVMVVGGGPGGMEAARTAALRGHRVSLYERSPFLGGQLNLASVAPTKQELSKWVRYLRIQIEKAGVEIHLGAEVTPELVERLKPDAVIVAVGANPTVPTIPGMEKNLVATAHDVLGGKIPAHPTAAVVWGGGMVGCETADFLADPGDNQLIGRTAVTLITSKKEVAIEMAPEARAPMLQRMRRNGVTIVGSATIKEILEDAVVIEREGEKQIIRPVDMVVLARGSQSADTLSRKLEGLVPEVYVIGDAKEPRQALDAIAEGAQIGRKV